MSEETTKEKILAAAEDLFGSKGIANTSLRRIVSHAGVNIAAVNYHFGSKDELIREVFRKQMLAVNSERVDRLEALRAESGGKPISPESLIRAFIEPFFNVAPDQARSKKLFRLIARAHSEPNKIVIEEMSKELVPVVHAFCVEFHRSRPGVGYKSHLLRIAFSVGAVVQSILLFGKGGLAEPFSDEMPSHEHLVEELLSFCSSGFEAPETKS